MTPQAYAELTRVRDEFLKTLSRTQSERSERQELVDTPGGYEIGWVAHERAVMLAEINRHRATADLPAIDLAEVIVVDNQAAGRSDYSRKFAFYCACLQAQP